MNIPVCVNQVVDTEAEVRLDFASWRVDRGVANVPTPYDAHAGGGPEYTMM